jgi:hypothetical protein
MGGLKFISAWVERAEIGSAHSLGETSRVSEQSRRGCGLISDEVGHVLGAMVFLSAPFAASLESLVIVHPGQFRSCSCLSHAYCLLHNHLQFCDASFSLDDLLWFFMETSFSLRLLAELLIKWLVLS